MNTNIVLGMDIPQLDLSNFVNSETQKLNLFEYLIQYHLVTKDITDAEISEDIYNRYITLRRENNPEFNRALIMSLSENFEKMFKLEVKKSFLVGEFYSTEQVKEKLKELYVHDYAYIEMQHQPLKVTDLANNEWFLYKNTRRTIDGKAVRGIVITKCLL